MGPVYFNVFCTVENVGPNPATVFHNCSHASQASSFRFELAWIVGDPLAKLRPQKDAGSPTLRKASSNHKHSKWRIVHCWCEPCTILSTWDRRKLKRSPQRAAQAMTAGSVGAHDKEAHDTRSTVLGGKRSQPGKLANEDLIKPAIQQQFAPRTPHLEEHRCTSLALAASAEVRSAWWAIKVYVASTTDQRYTRLARKPNKRFSPELWVEKETWVESPHASFTPKSFKIRLLHLRAEHLCSAMLKPSEAPPSYSWEHEQIEPACAT